MFRVRFPAEKADPSAPLRFGRDDNNRALDESGRNPYHRQITLLNEEIKCLNRPMKN